MEGMARGCVPVCTAVGGIPEHVRPGENGCLLPVSDDDAVVEFLCRILAELVVDRQELARLSAAAHTYARQHFGGEGFCEQYRRVIEGS
jgi:glycosyltransferase involved in cell wall biosynthesis